MRQTQLVFFEGLAGSGKSTMTHFMARQLKRADIPCTWHYEANASHPLHPFHDMKSFRQFHRLIEAGQFQSIFDIYLENWQQFACQIRHSEEVILLDNLLFGALIWMLFPSGMPEVEFGEYLARVAEVIAPLDPCLIYLSQHDSMTALSRWLTRWGGNMEQSAIATITASNYGKQHDLAGFDGLLRFWSDYHQMTDRAFSRFPFMKRNIENTTGNWMHSQQQVLDFLDVLSTDDLALSSEELQQFVGHYQSLDHGEGCVVEYENEYLFLRGPAVVWQKNKLIPVAFDTFEIQSLPFVISFFTNEQGLVERLKMSGPKQLLHTVNHIYHWIEPELYGSR